MRERMCPILGDDGWLEQVGEVELIGGFADVPLAAEFAATIDASSYQAFASSYDAVAVFVSNRTPRGFQIHAIRTGRTRLSATRCAWHLIGRRMDNVSET